MSELGLVYFLDRTADRKTLSVCSSRGQQTDMTRHGPMGQVELDSRTSRACRSAVPGTSPLRALTDLENSSLVCSSRCSRSAGDSWSNVRLRDGRSGFRRKNSRQKPSECWPSWSAASWSSFRESVGWMVDGWDGMSCLQTFDHMQDVSGFWSNGGTGGKKGKTAQTLNNSSYSPTIFCWKASGRGCWVRGDLSMYGRAGLPRLVSLVWSRSSGLQCTELDSPAHPLLGIIGSSWRSSSTSRMSEAGCYLHLQIVYAAGRIGSRWRLKEQVFVCHRGASLVYSDPLWLRVP